MNVPRPAPDLGVTGNQPVMLRRYENQMPDATIAAFERWMLSTSRAGGTIRLRVRHIEELARRVHPLRATSADLEGMLFDARSLESETRKSMLSSWRLFYRWARRHQLVEVDPTADIESIPVHVKPPRVAADAAVLRGLERATPHERAMILLARYACLRLSELTTLHTRNREHDMLRITGKGNKQRLVGANDDLLHALITLEDQQGAGYYFRGLTGPHMHPQSVHKIIYRVTGTNPHSLRHAGATAAYRATGDLRAVQDMLGHASLATTQRYLHLDNDARRRVAAGTIIDTRRSRTLPAAVIGRTLESAA